MKVCTSQGLSFFPFFLLFFFFPFFSSSPSSAWNEEEFIKHRSSFICMKSSRVHQAEFIKLSWNGCFLIVIIEVTFAGHYHSFGGGGGGGECWFKKKKWCFFVAFICVKHMLQCNMFKNMFKKQQQKTTESPAKGSSRQMAPAAGERRTRRGGGRQSTAVFWPWLRAASTAQLQVLLWWMWDETGKKVSAGCRSIPYPLFVASKISNGEVINELVVHYFLMLPCLPSWLCFPLI